MVARFAGLEQATTRQHVGRIIQPGFPTCLHAATRCLAMSNNALRLYSGSSAGSASVPDPPGGMKLAAKAKARMGTLVPSGAIL